MKAIIVARGGSGHQQSWGGAFAEGLTRHGWQVEVREDPAACDLLVLWGVRRIQQLKARRIRAGKICVLERGYLGDRFAWTSVSFGGGLNRRGMFRGPFADGSRFEKHFAQLLQPWRDRPDGYALIMQQVPGDCSIDGVDMPAFYEAARAELGKAMPVKIRAHPNVTPKRDGDAAMAAARSSLQEDLAGARCVVTWNSNSGVDAVMAGVRTVAMDPGSMAWEVTGHELALPPAPDRTQWAHALAWKQWREDEMRSGDCWAHVNPFTEENA